MEVAVENGDHSTRLALLERGQADAKATSIYAAAYSTTAEARNLYAFTKTMDTYKKIVSENDTLVLSTGSELFRYLSDSSVTAKK